MHASFIGYKFVAPPVACPILEPLFCSVIFFPQCPPLLCCGYFVSEAGAREGGVILFRSARIPAILPLQTRELSRLQIPSAHLNPHDLCVALRFAELSVQDRRRLFDALLQIPSLDERLTCSLNSVLLRDVGLFRSSGVAWWCLPCPRFIFIRGLIFCNSTKLPFRLSLV